MRVEQGRAGCGEEQVVLVAYGVGIHDACRENHVFPGRFERAVMLGRLQGVGIGQQLDNKRGGRRQQQRGKQRVQLGAGKLVRCGSRCVGCG